jgi:ectoine hydroxylase-related dioxygenase (phytanoyl-CoA dioxygenase family)
MRPSSRHCERGSGNRARRAALEEQLESDGFAVVNDVLSSSEVESLLRTTEPLDSVLLAAGRGGLRDAARESKAILSLVSHPAIRQLVETVLGRGAFCTRSVLFDKHPAANWKVPWHQDLSIAVREKESTPGYGPWSIKNGVPHVQAPASVLEQMVTVRVHLDDCGESNGPMRIVIGSHRLGRLAAHDSLRIGAARDWTTCVVRRGGCLLMRPLAVHASSAATSPARRRVVHLDYASRDLDGRLEWAERLAATIAV